MMEGGDTAGWHRKWVVLLGLLGWLFLYRYRVMGWLLSKVITYQLSKSHSNFSPVTVRVERVSLQPLRFFNVELSTSGSTTWRVILSKVEVQSHVKEFFESFGLVKICILAIEEVVGDVENVDEELIRDALLPSKMKAKSTVGATRPKTNPICYMRFVDLKVESIRLRINCLETTSRFICQKLYVGITDVFVQRDMLQLKIQTKSMTMQTSPQREGLDESDGSDGMRLEVPDTNAVLDLHLRNQRFLGCKMVGCEEQTTSVVVSTAFLERLLLTRNELIQKAVATTGDTKSSGEISGATVHPAVSPTELEISGFHLGVTVVENVDTVGSVPLQYRADVRKVTYSRQLVPCHEYENSPSDIESSGGNNNNDEARVCLEGLVQNVQVCNIASGAKLLSVISVDVRAKQTATTRGVVMGTFEKVDFFLSHRSEKILRSLVATQERVEKCQKEAKRMINCALTKWQERESHIHWDAELEVTSWMLSFKAMAKDGGIHDFTAYGTATSIQTPLAPVLSDNGSSSIKRCVVVQHINVDIIPSGLTPHSAAFGAAKVILTNVVDPTQNTKTTGTSIKFGYASINGLLPESSGELTQFPAMYLHDVKIDREEKASCEATEIDLDVSIDNTNVNWDYRRHKTFLVEWTAIMSVVDQLDLLVASTSSSKKKRPTGTQDSQTEQPPQKIVGTNVHSKDTTIEVIDIPDVAASATFCLTDTRLNHRATQLSVTTAFNCAGSKLCWGEVPSTIEMSDASFQNRSSLGRQRYLTKVPIQSDIRCSSLKMHLRPCSRMLLLFLRLDQLSSGSNENVDTGKRSSVQGISFNCGTFTIELEGEQQSESVASIKLNTFGIKMTRCTPREITETMTRLANNLGKEGFGGRTFTEVADKVMVMDGTASAGEVSAAVPCNKLVELHDTELRFATTDVEWSQLLSWDQPGQEESLISRTLGFDLSLLSERMNLALERKLFESLLRLVPILQEAFDTKEVQTNDSDTSDQPSFRLRYVGNFDVAFQGAELTYPYGDKDGREQIGSRVTRVLLSEVAFNLRQFQVLNFKCSPLRVLLEDAASIGHDGAGIDRGVDSLQLLFVPEVSVHLVIHWRNGIHYSGKLQYALSLEIAIGNMHPRDQPARVPLPHEALVAINWDCVYPWLICVATDDDDEYPTENATGKEHDEADDSKRLQCIGVQWDVSVSLVQIAWWDTATQETGMLIILNEFLTHGVLRTDSPSSSLELDLEGQSRWKLWEATVYLHLFRGYLLHVEDDFASVEEMAPDVLPFGSEMASNFSLETVGTSYRNTYTPEEGEDWDALDDEVTATFAPSSSTMFEKMHDDFGVIDYEFAIASLPKVPLKQETTVGRLPLLHLPVSVRTSAAAISPPKSPRSAKNWTQNIRNRLSRLKRRSTSMDNLFLKDGSCPIQVDSMRLLWTIQTRDSIFYMVTTTMDSLQLLMDAQRNSNGAEGQTDAENACPYSPRRVKRNSFRSPSFVSNASDADTSDPIAEAPRILNRRGSTRDTLLDLLQQGKLGMAQDSDREASSTSFDEDNSSPRGSVGEDTADHEAPKSIAMKAYTVDIHDAQINIREENTRSNMLLASKHIHFEIGTDAGENNTIAKLTFDNVTAHVAPIDVDITAGVLWYSHSDVGSPSASSSTLLKQIMDECSLTSAYRHTRATGATSTEVDLSFLQLSTDRHQFYQLMNVIRHVLLAPPSVARRPKRTYTPRTYSTESPPSTQHENHNGGDIMVFVPPSPTSSTNTLSGSTSTKKLHVLLEEELRNREVRTRGASSRSKATALKAISFKAVGMQWRLRLSREITGNDHEFVGIRIQGFAGCHTYFTNHCTKLTLNLQWLEVSNLHPGPSSAAFEDPTAVLKAKLLVDKRFESSSKLTPGNQKGMLVVRAESGPIVRVHGQKLRVLEVLEVSMFPEISNMIVIQLASDFYELIYKFFFENVSPIPASSQNSEQVFFGRKSTYGPVSPTATNSSGTPNQRGSSSPFTRSRAPPTSPLPPHSSLRPLRKTNSSGSTANLADSSSNLASAGGPNSPTSASGSEEVSVFEDSDSTADDCELFYVKYVRVGNVRLRINCNGFFVNLSHFDLELPPYVCQSKLCTSKKLLQKFESHLKWYITKESASSGLSQFKNKLLKWTPSSSSTDAKKDKSKKQEEDTAVANAQVLFGPYSGTST